MKKLIKKVFSYQGIRFLFVGGLNTIVGYGVYALLVYLNVNYLLANTISTVIGVAHSYLWNRFFTFKSKQKAIKEITKFVSVYIISYLIGMCTLYLFKDKLNISAYIAGLINLIITTLISYFGHKYISFRDTNMKSWNLIKKYKSYIISFVLFVLYFCLLLTFKNKPQFMDEADVFLGAKSLAKFKLMYIGFASQHLPLTYILMVPVAFFAKTYTQFRIGAYVILSSLFVFIYNRYNKFFGKFILILYPIFYIWFMSIDFLSSSIISEHFQSQFLVILLFELLMFNKNKVLSKSSKIIIPISMVSAVGCAFVSVIPIFIFVIGMFYIDIKNYIVVNKKFNLSNYFKNFIKNYFLIIFIGISIVVIYIIFLLLTNSFNEFIKQAFYLNTEIYSKYNGYSSNPFKTLVISVPRFIFIIKSYILQLNTNKPMFIFGILIYFGVWLYLLKTLRKNKFFNIILFMLLIAGGNRGFIGFHAFPYFSIASIYTLLFINDLNIYLKKFFVIILIILLGIKFIPNIRFIGEQYQNNDEYIKILDKLITNDEMTMIIPNTPLFINLNKISSSKFAGMVPWFAEIYEKEYLKDIKKEKPNVIIHNPYSNIWGYEFKDFVPMINKFILNNYTYYGNDIWIKNDNIDNAKKKIKKNIPFYNNDFLNEKNSENDNYLSLENNFLVEKIKTNQNIKSMTMIFGKIENNNCLIKISIVDNNQNNLYENEITTNDINDDGEYNINFINSLNSNTEYNINISSNNDKNCPVIFLSKDTLNYDNNYLMINNKIKENVDLKLKLYD